MFIGAQLTLVVICTLVPWFHNIYDLGADNAKSGILPCCVDGDNGQGLPRQYCALAAAFCPSCCYTRVYWRLRRVNGRGLKVIRILLLFKQGEPRTSNVWCIRMPFTVLSWGTGRCHKRILKPSGDSSPTRCIIVSMLAIIATGVDTGFSPR